MAGARGEELGGVRLGAAGLAAVVEPRGLHRPSPGRFEVHPAFGQRVLDALVLADRPVEHDAFRAYFAGAAQRVLADADRLGCRSGCARG